MLLAALAACGEASTELEVLAVVEGRAHAPGAPDLSGLHAIWRPADGSAPDSAGLGTDGAFSIEVTTAAASGDLLIRDPAGTYHPFLFPFAVDEAVDLDVVLVPRSWTIQRGRYAGETVPTHLDPVVDDEADQLLYSYWWGQPTPRSVPERYLLELMLWPEGALPARTAFDHANAGYEITPADSAAIWAVLDEIEAAYGLDFFEPAAADPSWWPVPTGPFDPDRVQSVVRLLPDEVRWSGRGTVDGSPDAWEHDLGTWADGRFDAFRVTRSYLDAGSVIVGPLEPLVLADGEQPWQTVLTHEVMHALGIGHTFRIPSPMGPRMRTDEPSSFDVAYMELLRAILALQETWETELGILPAVIGERRILLGKTALPELTG